MKIMFLLLFAKSLEFGSNTELEAFLLRDNQRLRDTVKHVNQTIKKIQGARE